MPKNSNKELRTCRVCGFVYDRFYPWGEDGNSSSFDICRCCGVEFGYGDNNPVAIKNWRGKWLSAGGQFKDKKYLPPNWSLEEQLKNIPEEFR